LVDDDGSAGEGAAGGTEHEDDDVGDLLGLE